VATQALEAIGADAGWVIDATEDPAQLVSVLGQRDVVVFLMTTGDVLDDTQQTAFEQFIRGGGGYVGVHSAADTEYDWAFYGQLMGAYFNGHPGIQQATVRVELPSHPAAAGLPAAWVRTDEWYNYQANPRPNVTVILNIDESTYSGGAMGADHPMAWCHDVDQGRGFYTELGHTQESWADPLYLNHVRAGIVWAAKR
jgi:type 1 glutamine amidotransferase